MNSAALLAKRKRALLAELAKRNRQKKILEDLHSGQKSFINARYDDGSLATFVGLLSARRFGKTEGALRYAGDLCSQKPRTRAVFIYQHRTDAVDIAWPILEDLAAQYEWRATQKRVELAYRFDNGSIIKLYGADDPRKHRRFKGQRNDLVVIDEAQDFHSDLQRLVHWLAPGVADRDGRIFLMGTPGYFETGYFFEVVWKGREIYPQHGTVQRSLQHEEWLVYYGAPEENPHTAKELRKLKATFKRANPKVEDEPWYQREFLARWVVDNRKLVCRVHPDINYLYSWKKHPEDVYILTIDWGFQGTAFSISTYNLKKAPYLVFLESEIFKGGMLTSEKANRIKAYQAKYPDLLIVADPGGMAKDIVYELQTVYGVPIQNAEKDNRLAQIELMNTDLSTGLVKIYNIQKPDAPEEHPLAQEWNKLIWVVNRNTGKREESTPRHFHDTALYARRFAYKHLFSPEAPKPPRQGTAEFYDLEEKRIRQAAERAQQERLESQNRRRRGRQWKAFGIGGSRQN